MNRLLDRHVWVAELVGACSVLTAIYGLVHLVKYFGANVPLGEMSRFSLGLFGVSLTVSGIAGVLITRRILERHKVERERLERERPSRAIWERALRNKLEENQRSAS